MKDKSKPQTACLGLPSMSSIHLLQVYGLSLVYVLSSSTKLITKPTLNEPNYKYEWKLIGKV